MSQVIFRVRFEFPERSRYRICGLRVRPMAAKQVGRFTSRHEIAIRHHPRHDPPVIADLDGLPVLHQVKVVKGVLRRRGRCRLLHGGEDICPPAVIKLAEV